MKEQVKSKEGEENDPCTPSSRVDVAMRNRRFREAYEAGYERVMVQFRALRKSNKWYRESKLEMESTAKDLMESYENKGCEVQFLPVAPWIDEYMGMLIYRKKIGARKARITKTLNTSDIKRKLSNGIGISSEEIRLHLLALCKERKRRLLRILQEAIEERKEEGLDDPETTAWMGWDDLADIDISSDTDVIRYTTKSNTAWNTVSVDKCGFGDLEEALRFLRRDLGKSQRRLP